MSNTIIMAAKLAATKIIFIGCAPSLIGAPSPNMRTVPPFIGERIAKNQIMQSNKVGRYIFNIDLADEQICDIARTITGISESFVNT